MFSIALRLALIVPLSILSVMLLDNDSSAMPVHGQPKIISVVLPADRDFYAGQTIRSSVVTSANVNYVEARVTNRNQALHHDGVGKFSLTYTIPWWLPPWLRHRWTLQIIARSVDGVEVKDEFPIHVH